MPLPKPTAIHSVSSICAIGDTLDSIYKNTKEQNSGLTFEHRYKNQMDSPMGEIPYPKLGISHSDRFNVDLIFQKMLSRSMEEISQKTSIFKKYKPFEIGLVVGTTTFGYSATEEKLSKNNTDFLSKVNYGKILKDLTKKYPIKGFSTVISTACTSSSLAIGLGHQLIQTGTLKCCLVGGFDVLSPITINGFDCLQILDHKITKPFTEERDGINLGEGGALLLLEKDSEEKPLAKIYGFSSNSEGYALSTPDPSGKPIESCILEALNQQNLRPSDISFINTHGTGTKINDDTEMSAIQNVFGEKIPKLQATKKLTGHLLAGSGSIEAAVSISFLQHLKGSSKTIFALSNSFGFGGSNACLLFGA